MTGSSASSASLVALSHDDRESYDRALHAARVAAYAPGEFVGQESLMQASDILRLAWRAGVGPTTSVLDLCCGVGGPGLWITRQLGCAYQGLDASPAAIAVARRRARDVDARFDVARIPPIPVGGYDVVTLLETLLAFPDKTTLFHEVSRVLPVGGRFAFTLEAGQPLTDTERSLMPDPDTVQLAPLEQTAGQLDCSRAHQSVAERLRAQFVNRADSIAGTLGPAAVEALVASHARWSEWLRTGRVRKIACVAEKARDR
jgi:ubiquinone/menaquinone biosynthesis C-methylase UbiE